MFQLPESRFLRFQSNRRPSGRASAAYASPMRDVAGGREAATRAPVEGPAQPPLRAHRQATPLAAALAAAGDRWTLLIVLACSDGTLRLNGLRSRLPGVSSAVLDHHVRQMVALGLLSRRRFREMPPRVELTLTESGAGLLPIASALARWGMRHRWSEQSDGYEHVDARRRARPAAGAARRHEASRRHARGRRRAARADRRTPLRDRRRKAASARRHGSRQRRGGEHQRARRAAPRGRPRSARGATTPACACRGASSSRASCSMRCHAEATIHCYTRAPPASHAAPT